MITTCIRLTLILSKSVVRHQIQLYPIPEMYENIKAITLANANMRTHNTETCCFCLQFTVYLETQLLDVDLSRLTDSHCTTSAHLMIHFPCRWSWLSLRSVFKLERHLQYNREHPWNNSRQFITDCFNSKLHSSAQYCLTSLHRGVRLGQVRLS